MLKLSCEKLISLRQTEKVPVHHFKCFLNHSSSISQKSPIFFLNLLKFFLVSKTMTELNLSSSFLLESTDSPRSQRPKTPVGKRKSSVTRSEEELRHVPSSSETLVHLSFMSTHFNILSTYLRKKRHKKRFNMFLCSFPFCISFVFMSSSLTIMYPLPIFVHILKNCSYVYLI